MAEAFRLDIAAPNLVNICIDEIRDGEKGAECMIVTSILRFILLVSIKCCAGWKI